MDFRLNNFTTENKDELVLRVVSILNSSFVPVGMSAGLLRALSKYKDFTVKAINPFGEEWVYCSDSKGEFDRSDLAWLENIKSSL